MSVNFLTKVCSKCVQPKALDEFRDVPARGGRKAHKQSWCSECHAAYNREHRPAYYAANHEKCNASVRITVKRLRDAVIDMYGGKCSCTHCGETRKNFLSLEHLQGGGTAHRKSINRYTLWRSILAAGVQVNKYAVLCYNCNCSRGFYGYCCDPSSSPQLYRSNTTQHNATESQS